MRFFYDQEFLEDGSTIDLLSIGIAADDDQGHTLYLVNRDADLRAVAEHDWLMANVVPHLPLMDIGGPWGKTTLAWDPKHHDFPLIQPRHVIAARVEGFVSKFSRFRKDHELWGWYADYDHVALCQLWGRMIDLPGCIPMFTHDLRQVVGKNHPPEQHPGSEHHALADAQWNRAAWHWWQAQNRPVQLEVKRTPVPLLIELVDTLHAMDSGQLDEVLHVMRGTPLASVLTRLASGH
jgi:hypothetical protein